MKKGFTLVELLISLVVIGILAGLGYKGYTIVTMNAKGKAVVSDIDKIKSAIATTVGQTGGYYQSSTPPACPQPINKGGTVTIETSPGNVDDTAFGRLVEQVFYDQLNDKGMRVVDDAATGLKQFRLGSYPIASISFPLEINGVKAIRIRGISGAIALRVLKGMNDTPMITPEDGGSPAKPVTIVKYASPGGQVGSEASAFGNCDIDEDDEHPILTSFNCLINDTGNDVRFDSTDPNILDTIENTPKVTIYYTYDFGTSWE